MCVLYILLGIWLWFGYEWYNAPTIDEHGNIIDKKEKERLKKYHIMKTPIKPAIKANV